MTIGDNLKAPAEKKTLLRLSAKELLQSYRRRTFHLKEDGDGLVVAEGEEEYFKLPNQATGIAAVPGKIFAHDPANERLYMMRNNLTGYEYCFTSTQEPYRVLRFMNKSGVPLYFGVTKSDVIYYNAFSTTILGKQIGGCAAAFRDRIFSASGNFVYYSKAFYGNNWTEERYGAGKIELVSDDLGEIYGMQPYKDKLFLFRKHGITALRVLGDELNFKAVHMNMKCGALVENTVSLCGENVGYFTDCGFYLFNGATSVLAENSRFDEIDFTKFCKAVTYCGRYYALVTKKEGGVAIYCYDPEQCEARFIENGAVDIASGDELYFTKGGKAYRFTKKGVSDNFTPYFTAENIAFGLGKEKTLRSIAIEGEGTFSITVSTGKGTKTIRGNANEILKFRSPLRGNGFNLKISVAPADAEKARFRAVSFRFTEEKDDD